MKIVFFGSDYYSTLVINELTKNPNCEIPMVITGVNDPIYPFEYETINQICLRNNIPVIKISSKDDFASHQEALRILKFDLGLVASFGYLIPKSIIQIPRLGILNIHPSLLPEYRGVSPMQQTILDGRDNTGVTIMKIDHRFDTGEIIQQHICPIADTDTTLSLAQKLFPIGASMFLDIINKYPQGNFPVMPQNGTKATQTKLITTEQAFLNLNDSDEMNYRKIHAFYPKPMAWCYLPDLINKYSPHPNPNLPPKWQKVRVKIYESEMIDKQLFPKTLQLEGKSQITWQQFTLGYLQ